LEKKLAILTQVAAFSAEKISQHWFQETTSFWRKLVKIAIK
jgi:hypothetical protein